MVEEEAKPVEEEKKQEGKPEAKEEKAKEKKAAVLRTAVPAEVLEILGKVGGKHTATQVRCKVMDGNDTGKITRRNVLGPVRTGDILMLTQTEMEAAAMRGGRR